MHGGRPWALPSATSQQIQAVRTQARIKRSTRGANGEDQNETSLRVRGGLGPDPKDFIRCVMLQLQSKAQVQLTEILEERPLGTDEWYMDIDNCSSVPTGKILVRLANSNMVRRFEDLAGNQVVSIGGTFTAIEIINFKTMALPRCLGN